MLFFGASTHWHSFLHLQRRLHRNGPKQVWLYNCGTADWTRRVAWPTLNVWVSLLGIILTFSWLSLVACCNTAWECHQMRFYLCHKFLFCFLFLLITSVSLTHWQRVLSHFTNLTWLVNHPDTVYWLLYLIYVDGLWPGAGRKENWREGGRESEKGEREHTWIFLRTSCLICPKLVDY